MPALESRGSISRTVQVPVESAFLFPTSTGTGAHSAVQSLLSYTAATTSEVVKFVSQGKQKNTASSSTNGGGGSSSADSASSGADSGSSSTECKYIMLHVYSLLFNVSYVICIVYDIIIHHYTVYYMTV